MIFTQAELDYLATQHIGRLATVAPDGQVQNNPTNFFVDADTGTIVIGGGALGASKKFRNVQRGSTVAFVVDDLATVDPWAPRGIEIRGTAVALTDQDPPRPGLSRETIKITPTKIVTWGLEGPRTSRAV
ncbi:PPOX class F420-dependent oxidoreductase [Actinomadura opuntiae]|uniref:PPOX class F420-dependent oxidoreductase n=1 Tax=Actinomadura sp. OS1-43 TaxID=604315 RepID=UPI00255AB486|nr:PPOX class F420-dependent oxidoreductase [Actinomadura sp. OS1-43]MDL4813358.1 PPOX class F420-dependent oxidoreductase [Actinomadura sp. OS1-43]